MSVHVGRHPVYVSHVKEVESLMYFVIDLQEQLRSIGLDSGEQYDCLGRVRQKCRDLLIKMYAEDSEIMLMDDLDLHWMKLIVGFDQNVIQRDQLNAG